MEAVVVLNSQTEHTLFTYVTVVVLFFLIYEEAEAVSKLFD